MPSKVYMKKGLICAMRLHETRDMDIDELDTVDLPTDIIFSKFKMALSAPTLRQKIYFLQELSRHHDYLVQHDDFIPVELLRYILPDVSSYQFFHMLNVSLFNYYTSPQQEHSSEAPDLHLIDKIRLSAAWPSTCQADMLAQYVRNAPPDNKKCSVKHKSCTTTVVTHHNEVYTTNQDCDEFLHPIEIHFSIRYQMKKNDSVILNVMHMKSTSNDARFLKHLFSIFLNESERRRLVYLTMQGKGRSLAFLNDTNFDAINTEAEPLNTVYEYNKNDSSYSYVSLGKAASGLEIFEMIPNN